MKASTIIRKVLILLLLLLTYNVIYGTLSVTVVNEVAMGQLNGGDGGFWAMQGTHILNWLWLPFISLASVTWMTELKSLFNKIKEEVLGYESKY